MSEKEKMLAGELYDANYNEELINERLKNKDRCYEYNNIKPSNIEERTRVLDEILGNTKTVFILSHLFGVIIDITLK